MRTTYYVVERQGHPVARHDTRREAESERRKRNREDGPGHTLRAVEAGRALSVGEYPGGTERESAEDKRSPRRRGALLVLLTPEERAAMAPAAKRAGLGLGSWLRMVGLREAAR